VFISSNNRGGFSSHGAFENDIVHRVSLDHLESLFGFDHRGDQGNKGEDFLYELLREAAEFRIGKYPPDFVEQILTHEPGKLLSNCSI
jgi:hypothetical protein